MDKNLLKDVFNNNFDISLTDSEADEIMNNVDESSIRNNKESNINYEQKVYDDTVQTNTGTYTMSTIAEQHGHSNPNNYWCVDTSISKLFIFNKTESEVKNKKDSIVDNKTNKEFFIQAKKYYEDNIQ